jgi:hypothetical protein
MKWGKRATIRPTLSIFGAQNGFGGRLRPASG